MRLALDCRRQGHKAARSMVFRTDCPSWIEESGNDTIRLVDYDTYTKAIFLNDVRFTYQRSEHRPSSHDTTRRGYLSAGRLRPGLYDGFRYLWCAKVHIERVELYISWLTVEAGLYDIWVTRDICCCTPLRTFWPYAKDKASVSRVKDERPFNVAACWNGALSSFRPDLTCSTLGRTMASHRKDGG